MSNSFPPSPRPPVPASPNKGLVFWAIVGLLAVMAFLVVCTSAQTVASQGPPNPAAPSTQPITVTTGPSSWALSGVVQNKPHLCLIGQNGVTGAMLSTAAQTKELSNQLGGISATSSFLVIAPNVAATLNAADLVNSTAITQSDTNYWTMTIINRGSGGAGTTQMLAATPQNTTKATGGAAMGAKTVTALALSGTPANLNTNANDVLEVTFTATGAPTALTETNLRLDFAFTS